MEQVTIAGFRDDKRVFRCIVSRGAVARFARRHDIDLPLGGDFGLTPSDAADLVTEDDLVELDDPTLAYYLEESGEPL